VSQLLTYQRVRLCANLLWFDLVFSGRYALTNSISCFSDQFVSPAKTTPCTSGKSVWVLPPQSRYSRRRILPDKETCYSPAVCTGSKKVPVLEKPDPNKISTSHIERQNLTVRMSMRRMTRLTNAFSKKWLNLKYAYALQFAFYNFCRVHSSLRVTPAMQAGLTDHVWDLRELL
jgi:hypothetical protein